MKKIVFTGVGKAELIETEMPQIEENHVLVETEYIAVSTGTERANLMRMPNTGAFGLLEGIQGWGGGYSSVGIVKEVGNGVKTVLPGDRVLTIWSQNQQYNLLPQNNVIKINHALLDLKYAAFAFIASFPAAAIRKTQLEFGESVIVFGMGILGALAVQLLRTAGAYPIIAVDLDKNRRKLALELGADYALDPADPDFVASVKEITDGTGVKNLIEVTGQSAALKQALDCAAPLGRLALLGCTRVSDTPIDFYQTIHRPGITIIGAHTGARPKIESYPHYWTERDDCTAILNFMANGRMDMSKILSEVHLPQEAQEVYRRMAENKDFPVGVVFDWRSL